MHGASGQELTSSGHISRRLTFSNNEAQQERPEDCWACRGGSDIKEIVKRIDMWALDMLFVVGGNGGNAGANAIQCECHRAGIPCTVIGVPKSIDNDILLVRRPRLSSARVAFLVLHLALYDCAFTRQAMGVQDQPSTWQRDARRHSAVRTTVPCRSTNALVSTRPWRSRSEP